MDLNEIGWASSSPAHSCNSGDGRVALDNREHFVVWTDQGEIEATISGHLRHSQSDFPCVGDWVIVRHGTQAVRAPLCAEKNGNVVTEVLPRHTKLSRKDPGKGICEQVL